MSTLLYEGTTRSGSQVRGRFVGDRESLVKQLQQDGILLTAVREDTTRLRGGSYRFADLRLNLEQLAFLVGAEVPIDQAVALLVRNARKAAVQRFWEAVLQSLRGGAQFSEALRQAAAGVGYPLPPFYSNLLSVGEETGDLKGALARLHEHLEFRAGLLGEVRSALAYPAFLVVASILTVLFVLGFVLPRFAAIYTAEEIARLPGISRLTLRLGQLTGDHIGFVLVALSAGLVALAIALLTPAVRSVLGRAASRLPVVQPLLLELDRADLFGALGSMLHGGVELSHALRLGRRVVRSPALRTLLEESESELKRGQTLSSVWAQHPVVPEEVLSLLTVGERGAQLPQVFDRAGQKHRAAFTARMGVVLTFLEPGVIALLGLFIGFIVVSIMLAVVSMSDLYAQ